MTDTSVASFSRMHDIEAIGLIGAAHASSHFYHLVIPSLLPWLMPAFGLSFTQSGLVVTTCFVVSGFGQAVSGIFADKVGARLMLYLGMLCHIAAAMLIGLSSGFFSLAAAAALIGLGNSTFHPVDYSLMNYNVSERMLGHAYAWHQVLGNVGWASCPLVMVSIATFSGWRSAAFSACAMAFLILTLILIRRKTLSKDQSNDPESKASKEACAEETSETFAFLKIPAVWLCFLFFCCTTMGLSCIKNFGPSIFHHSYGMTLHEASIALTVYLIAAALGSLLGGFLTNQKAIDLDRVVALCMAFGGIMAVLMASCVLPAIAVPFMTAAMGFGVGLGGPSRDTLIRGATLKKLSKRSTGRVYGFVYCGMDVGQSVSPLLFGMLMDMGYFAGALYLIAVFQVLAILTVIRVGSETRLA